MMGCIFRPTIASLSQGHEAPGQNARQAEYTFPAYCGNGAEIPLTADENGHNREEDPEGRCLPFSKMRQEAPPYTQEEGRTHARHSPL